ncbi:MAG: hypothetical protein Q8R13_00615 [bacterium]|nr:hypothetical protein [bacterium]MDZ4295820.1 hypothetical protein [Patescibacteria group bacterium]
MEEITGGDLLEPPRPSAAPVPSFKSEQKLDEAMVGWRPHEGRVLQLLAGARQKMRTLAAALPSERLRAVLANDPTAVWRLGLDCYLGLDVRARAAIRFPPQLNLLEQTQLFIDMLTGRRNVAGIRNG